MSLTRTTGRHRKPRTSRAATLIRGGVLSGVLGTVAVSAPTAGAADDAEKPTEATGELPTLDSVLEPAAAEATQATHEYLAETELRAAQERHVLAAEKLAAQRKAEEIRAEEAAEAERRRAEEAAAAEAERRAEAEATASRSSERSSLSTSSATTKTESTPSAPPASGAAAAIVAFARAQVGDSYALGATGADTWDCSGLTQAAYAAAGLSLPRTSQSQSVAGTVIPVSQAQPGDILYWGSAGSAYHVGIYVGGGRFVGAQNPSTGVVEKDFSWSPPTGAVRIG